MYFPSHLQESVPGYTGDAVLGSRIPRQPPGASTPKPSPPAIHHRPEPQGPPGQSQSLSGNKSEIFPFTASVASKLAVSLPVGNRAAV